MASINMKRLLIGIPLILIIGALVIVGMIFFIDTNSKNMTATAEAEIVNAAPVSWVVRRVTKNGYSVTYHFKTADGRSVENRDERNTLYSPGTKTLRVCYDPNNPSDSELRHPTRGSECGKGLLF